MNGESAAADPPSDGEPSSSLPPRVAVLTAYTTDYTLGAVCAEINRTYAAKHGYHFLCREHPPWSNDAERHPTWHKVSLINEVLQSLLSPDAADAAAEPIVPRDTTLLLWVDADAAVIHHDTRFETLWDGLHDSIHLLIGEDVTPACLVNAGILGVRVSAWSARLWRDVWQSRSSKKYYWLKYHEQSALLRQLMKRGEGLPVTIQSRAPFHSYCGGPRKPKIFPHVAVLARRAFNTNRYALRADAVAATRVVPLEEDACDFIFHAAGHPTLRRVGATGTVELWKPPKAVALAAVLEDAGLPLPPALQAVAAPQYVFAVDSLCTPAPRRRRVPTHVRFPGRIMN